MDDKLQVNLLDEKQVLEGERKRVQTSTLDAFLEIW
jgi:hypothetical protein